MTIPPGALGQVARPRRPFPLPRVRSLPWSARDLVRRHGRFFGAGGLLLGGFAFGAGAALWDVFPAGCAAAYLVGGVLAIEGCVLAFPRPGVGG